MLLRCTSGAFSIHTPQGTLRCPGPQAIRSPVSVQDSEGPAFPQDWTGHCAKESDARLQVGLQAPPPTAAPSRYHVEAP